MFFNFLLVLLVIFTRFWGLNWGDSLFFHPDENNMAASVSQLSSDNFNPHFFAYGQPPLYLAYFSLKAVGLTNTFSNSVYALRFWSAVFSCLSILFFYLLFRSKILVLLLIFTPGLIQLAHFGTTESLLLLIFAIDLYLSSLIFQKPKPIYFFFVSLVTGIGLATKVSSLIFLAPVFFAVIFSKQKNKFLLTFFTVYCLLFTLLFSFIFSPFNLIVHSDFLSTLRYETGVALGRFPVFYTNQFLHATPYLFQFTHIFPYVVGLPMFIFGFIGLCLIRRPTVKWVIMLVSSLVYFLYFGQTYTKWTRFISPIFFVFPLLTTYLIEKSKKFSLINKLILIISILPGILFMKIYFQPDIRLTASNWINQNLPPNSVVLSEAGNIINIPVVDSKLQVTNFDFYGLDTNPDLIAKLPQIISDSDYILIPSRRIFKNQNNPSFPYSQKYYQSLFSGELGFTQIKQFSVFNDESAEETWSVFDHPTIRIFKKVKQLNQSQYDNLLKT